MTPINVLGEMRTEVRIDITTTQPRRRQPTRNSLAITPPPSSATCYDPACVVAAPAVLTVGRTMAPTPRPLARVVTPCPTRS